MFEFTLKQERIKTPETQQALKAAVRKLIHDVADEILRRSQDKVPVSDGMLKKSGNVIYGDGYAIVGYNTDYALYVHDGSKPHMPPVEALYPWVRKHPSRTEVIDVEGAKIAVDAKRKYGRRSRETETMIEDEDPKVKRDAWALAMHIKKHGTKAHKYLEEAVREVQAELSRKDHGQYLSIELKRRGVT